MGCNCSDIFGSGDEVSIVIECIGMGYERCKLLVSVVVTVASS